LGKKFVILPFARRLDGQAAAAEACGTLTPPRLEDPMRRLALGVLTALIAGGAACTLLLPDNWVAKGPIWNSFLGRGIDPPQPEIVKQRLRAASGFEVRLWAEGIPNARFMRFSPKGALLVSQPRLGRVLQLLADRDGDGVSDGQRVFLDDLDHPHGIDFRQGHVYIGEGSAIARVAYVESKVESKGESEGESKGESGAEPIEPRGEVVRIATGIPKGGNHWARTLRFGPDGGLYLNVGSSCNVCEEMDPRRGTLMRFSADGSGGEIYAAGLRNSTGFDWRPGTDELFATDNGRDLLGDDEPPCELNRVVRGGFYGWPYANGFKQPDPDFGAGQERRIEASIPPVHPFRAHNAPLGIIFVRHPEALPSMRGAALVALHGSWNRSELDGYKVVSLHWDEADRITERDFLTGFQLGDDVIGRPVDVAEGPDGAFYVSDDYAGVIYRVAPIGAADSVAAQAPTRQSKFPEPPPAVANPLADFDAATRAELSARGAALFAEHACASCHDPNQAAAGVSVKPLEQLAERHSVNSLQAFLLTPQPPMPVVDLPEKERLALAVYVLSEFAAAPPASSEHQ
jgi:glucose/arabinose dehydrogenase